MDRKEISFKSGIRRAPSMSLDAGELSECVNLIPRNGELVNIKPCADAKVSDSYTDTSGITRHGKFMYVHSVPDDDDHFIFVGSEGILFFKLVEDETDYHIDNAAGTIDSISAIGKFIVVKTDTILKYYLWESRTKGYKALGEKPMLKIDFALDGDIKSVAKTDLLKFAKKAAVYDEDSFSKYLFDTTVSVKNSQLPLTSLWHDVKLSAAYTFASDKKYAVKNTSSYSVMLRVNSTDDTGKWISAGDYYIFTGNGLTTDKPLQASIKRYYFGDNDDKKRSLEFYEQTEDGDYLVIDPTDSGAAFTEVLAAANEFIDNTYRKNKLFIAPFLVRYGLRMYDGSMVSMSAPVYMIPNKDVAPYIVADAGEEDTSTEVTTSNAVLYARACNLLMKIANPEVLVDWEDLILSIEIGISKPIWQYDADRIYTADKADIKITDLSADAVRNFQGCLSGNWKGVTGWLEERGYLPSGSEEGTMKYCVSLPDNGSTGVKRSLSLTSSFYRIKEIKYHDIINDDGTIVTDWMKEYNLVDLSEIDIADLESQTALPVSSDDYTSVYPKYITSYNSRLIAANVYLEYKVCDNIVSPWLDIQNANEGIRTIVYLSNNGKEIILDYGWEHDNLVAPIWMFYPNTNAKRIVLYKRLYDEDTGEYSYYKVANTLESHTLLGGAFAYTPDLYNESVWQSLTDKYLADIDYDPDDPEAAEAAEATAKQQAATEATKAYATESGINTPNALYFSQVNNPLVFSLDKSSLVGQGEIRGLATSAKALSSGTQFGTFPLYAFCSDGIWPMEVTETGTFDAPQPLSRDVVSNPDAICQIDQAIVYPTNAGLKILQSQEQGVISESLRGYNVDESQFYSDIDSAYAHLRVTDTTSIAEILENSKILYDYANGLLHIYPDDPDYTTVGEVKYYKHFVFSLQTREWSSVVDVNSKVTAIVPGYPYGYLQNEFGQIMYFNDAEDNSTLRKGLLLTRPVSFDDPIGMKALCDFEMIYGPGGFAWGIVQPFVSNDGKKWYKLTSLRSRAFKWFRFRVRTLLTDLDALTGMVCDIETRRSNKLR